MVIPLIVTVVGGVIVFRLTEGRSDPQAGGGGSGGGSSQRAGPDDTTTGPPQPLSGETNDPQPAVTCGGRINRDGQVEPVPGAGRNAAIDWTADLHSANFSSTGEDRIRRALCGWATIAP